MNIFDVEYYILLTINWALLVVKVFAFITALTFSAESYTAAGKLSKPAWLAILGFAALLQLVPVPIFFVNLAFTIAAFVYLADVRPALRGLRRR